MMAQPFKGFSIRVVPRLMEAQHNRAVASAWRRTAVHQFGSRYGLEKLIIIAGVRRELLSLGRRDAEPFCHLFV
jgi:hypothetical protein